MTRRECLVLPVAAALTPAAEPAPQTAWPQWGGPQRDFIVPGAPKRRPSWPAGGPPVLWKRALGEGHSSPAAEGGRPYTMYNRGGRELTVAINAQTGATVWEAWHAIHGQECVSGAGQWTVCDSPRAD